MPRLAWHSDPSRATEDSRPSVLPETLYDSGHRLDFGALLTSRRGVTALRLGKAGIWVESFDGMSGFLHNRMRYQ